MMNADPQPADSDSLLLEFVRDRDAPCPMCGYNLRNLPTPTCPECRELLSLTVGVRKPRFGWFVVAITPGFFSGICAVLMLVPLVVQLYSPSGPAPWPIWAADAFGWLSCLAALVLVKYRYGFLRLPQAVQRGWALTAWAFHLTTFALLITFMWLQ